MAASATKVVAWSVGGLLLALLLIAGLALAALFWLDWSIVKPYAESAASSALQRDVTIGLLDVYPGTTSTIHLQDVTVSNPDWAESDTLATVEELHLSLRTWPLLFGQLELIEVQAVAPALDLERNADGQATWDVGSAAETAGEVAAPETRDEFPTVGRLLIDDGKVRYRDAVRGVALDGDLATVTGEAEEGDRVELAVKGSLEERPLSLDFKGGSFEVLRDSAAPYPVDLSVQFGETALSVAGTVTEPLQMAGFDLEIDLQGPSLAQLFPLLGIPLPETLPYSLAGALAHEDEIWRVTGLQGTVGDSDLSGEVTLDQGAEPPMLTADLVSTRLAFEDLAGLIGAEPGADAEAEAKESDSVFPQTEIADERLRAMNMDVTFKGEQVITDALPIDNLSARLQLTDGRALVSPLDFGVAGGSVSGEMALNTREEVPSADADLAFEALDLKPFFEGTEFVQEMGGRFFGQLYVLGQGKTLDAMMASAEGEGWVGIRDGTLSGLLIEAAGLDIAEALVLVVDDDARVALRCGRADLKAQAGTARVERAIIDTADSILLAKGQANLDAETLDLQIEARPKDFSLIDLAAPVILSGKLKDPDIAIGGVDPLPFLEMGQAEDLNCDRLLEGKISPAEVEAEAD